MIWVLRYIGVLLWVCCLFAIPASFYILPRLARFFPSISPLIVCGVILLAIFCLFGVLMNIIARRLVRRFIKEGQTWERSGIEPKAQKNYIRALRIYDTFLLWPFSAKKTAMEISGAIAAFQLNTHSEHQNLKLGTAVYLKINPQDEDIAKLWLTQLSHSSIISTFEQDVLTILAQIHMNNRTLASLIAEIFLDLQRNDYVAGKLYQEVKHHPDLANLYQERIQELVKEPPDESVDNLGGETLLKPDVYTEAKVSQKKRMEIKKFLLHLSGQVISLINRIWMLLMSLSSSLIQVIGRVISYFRHNEKMQFYLKAGVMTIICCGLAFFMISTVTHTFKTRALEKKKIALEAATPKPFTIQVAAYLKLSHANRYVDILKKKEIDASVKKVDGGGKTWFVVRVSKFADKKGAAEYGLKLRQQGIIDDFFVNNR